MYPETVVVNFVNKPTLGTHKIWVHTKNGDGLKDKIYYAYIDIVSSYRRKGGCNMFNAYLEGQEVTLENKGSKKL